MNSSPPPDESLLIVAHPGHELLVHNWLESAGPEVVALTDGSAKGGPSRLDSSRQTIEAAGGSLNPLSGTLADVDVYRALLQGDVDIFRRLLDQLTDLVLERKPRHLVGDAREGYNPTHDLCRALIDNVTTRARSAGLSIVNHEFSLFHPHRVPPDPSGAIVIELDEAALSRKMKAAERYPELRSELEAVAAGTAPVVFHGDPELSRIADVQAEWKNPRALAVECLTVADDHGSLKPEEVPFYELYGEHLSRIGRYSEVIRYRQHVAPILEALAAGSR